MGLSHDAWPVLGAFVAASVVLAATPGPGVLYIVTRTLAHGRRAGLASVGGVALGNLGNAVGTALVLGALLAASSLAFDIVRYAGAAVLLILGVQALRAVPHDDAKCAAPAAPPPRNVRDAFLVALLNPKTALFFAAFLPQFIVPGIPALLQVPAFAAAFVAIAAVSDTGYVLAAHAAAPALRRHAPARVAGRCASATVYFALALFAALSNPRGAR